ncbi:MAG: hypothetical protein ACK4KV_18870 [Rhodocyclaceae bacterium]
MKLLETLRRSALAVSLAAGLAACGGGSGGDDDHHDEVRIDTAGRLAIAEAGGSAVHVLDLDSGSVLQSFQTQHPVSALYSSPGSRYALAIQRVQDLVQFVDGGLWQEDHVDHLHDYQQPPRLLGFSLAGPRPTHYEVHGVKAALFMDGHADSGRNAEVLVFGDDDIGAARIDARLALSLPMHGTAELRGQYMLSTYREPQAASTLPEQVELYRREGSGYAFVQRFAEPCPGLHGSIVSGAYTLFGCTDGVLVVEQQGDAFSARKLANPSALPEGGRIGSFVGAEGRANVVGIAGSRLFDIDPAAGTLTPIAWSEERTRRAQTFDGDGRHLLVLDDTGTVHLLDAEAGWQSRAALPAVSAMPSASPFPAIVASKARDRVYVADPAGHRIVVIDPARAVLDTPIGVSVSPTTLAWLGIAGHAHDH